MATGKPYAAARGGEINIDYILELECSLVEIFHWSLHDIDATDIDSLLPFIFHWPIYKNKTGARRVCVDEVDWL